MMPPVMLPLPRSGRRALGLLALLVAGGVIAAGCAKKSPTAPSAPRGTRSWFMGFSAIPPRDDFSVLVQALQLWTPRADASIGHDGVPWDSLLAGVPPETLVVRYLLGLSQYYRGHGFTVTYEIDPTNGLNRAQEDAALVRAGRSIAEPAIRAMFIRWATAVDSIAPPDYLGIASETNLIRAIAPAPLYGALVALAREAADSLQAKHVRWRRARDPVLYTTVQVEVAWGRLVPASGYVGIAADLADFPYSSVLGLSSYPYLGGFAEPESLPADYYARIATEAARPVMVTEGGWTSVTGNGQTSTPEEQARYIRTQGRLLAAAHALGWYQLTFTDLDLANSPPPPPGTSLEPFAHCGLVDIALVPKPALAPWDSLFALRRAP
jgi:hypothetical protein